MFKTFALFMKRYTPQSQLKIPQFSTPFEQHLDPNNKWVKLAQRIPWDACAKIYLSGLKDFGRPVLDARLAIGALIIKHKKQLSDRGVLEEISENVYLQYFVGFASFKRAAAFHHSMMSNLRKQMGEQKFDAMNDELIKAALELEDNHVFPNGGNDECGENQEVELSTQGSHLEEDQQENKGKLKLDATVADQYIKYPTDLNLLNESREELERIMDKLWSQSEEDKKPRSYRKRARKDYLAIGMKKKKSKAKIRRGIRKQLGYVRRNIKIINVLWDELGDWKVAEVLEFRDYRIFWVVQQIYNQQKQMYEEKSRSHPHRIVNIYQPYVRPIPRGKDKGRTEFGAKIGLSEHGGFCRLDHLSWEAYHEGKEDLVYQVERYKKLYGHYPELLLVDGIYLTRANRKWLKEKGIRHVGKPLGRKKKLNAEERKKIKQERGERNHIEGKIGQGKNAYGLSEIRARRADTSGSWIAAIIFVMNLVRFEKLLAVLWIVIQMAYLFLVALRKALTGLGLEMLARWNKMIFRLFPIRSRPRDLTLFSTAF